MESERPGGESALIIGEQEGGDLLKNVPAWHCGSCLKGRSRVIHDALKDAHDKGILVVVAAGNEGKAGGWGRPSTPLADKAHDR